MSQLVVVSVSKSGRRQAHIPHWGAHCGPQCGELHSRLLRGQCQQVSKYHQVEEGAAGKLTLHTGVHIANCTAGSYVDE